MTNDSIDASDALLTLLGTESGTMLQVATGVGCNCG